MGIKWHDNGSATVIHHYRRKDGTKSHVSQLIKSPDKFLIAKALLELKEKVQGGSLKTKFSKCVEHTLQQNNGAGMRWVYTNLNTELGGHFVDEKFPEHWRKFLKSMKRLGRAQNTIAHHNSVMQTILTSAFEDGLIDEMPIREFDTRLEFRERVWTPKEREKLFAAAERSKDKGLWWRIYFASMNPVRKMDFRLLLRERLVLVGDNAPYVSFYPRKTGKSAKKPAVLAEIDRDLLQFFAENEKMFPDCPYLFPGIYYNARRNVWRWTVPGNFWKAFSNCCNAANVQDFHIHDLKHVAITHMLSKLDSTGHHVYTRDTLKKFGIQMSDRSIDVYDQTEAMDELSRIRGTQVEHKLNIAGN